MGRPTVFRSIGARAGELDFLTGPRAPALGTDRQGGSLASTARAGSSRGPGGDHRAFRRTGPRGRGGRRRRNSGPQAPSFLAAPGTLPSRVAGLRSGRTEAVRGSIPELDGIPANRPLPPNGAPCRHKVRVGLRRRESFRKDSEHLSSPSVPCRTTLSASHQGRPRGLLHESGRLEMAGLRWPANAPRIP